MYIIPRFYGITVYGYDAVGGAKPGFVGGGFGGYGADEGGCFGVISEGDKEAEQEGKDDVAERTGDGDGYFMPGRDVGKGLGFFVAVVSLDFLHTFWVELRQGDISANGEETNLIDDTVYLFLKEGGPHSDGKGVDLKTAFSGDVEVSPFVNKDGDAKEKEHHENDINNFKHD